MFALLADVAKAGAKLLLKLAVDEVRTRIERRLDPAPAKPLSHRDVQHQQAQIRSATTGAARLKVVPK